MSWFERRRQRAREALSGEPTVVPVVSSDREPEASLERAVEVETEPAAGALERPATDTADLTLPTISVGRAGRYVITDATGAEVGTILGDYVIGFTVRCWDLNRHFTDMESAMAAIAVEAQARATARLLRAS